MSAMSNLNRHRSEQLSRGFTWVELLVVIVILGMLAGLLLPAVRTSSGAARRMACSHNFKNIALGLYEYHDSFGALPMQQGGTYDLDSDHGGTSMPGNNRHRLSVLVAILPFIEQQPLWEQISSGRAGASPVPQYAPMGPAPWTRQFDPWQTEIPMLRCPSDPGIGIPAHGRTNFAVCLGDATHWMNTGPRRFNPDSKRWENDREGQVAASGRGAFVPRKTMRFADISDGLAHTILMGELATDLGDRDIRTSGPMTMPWNQIHSDAQGCADMIDQTRPMYWSPDAEAMIGFGNGPNDQRRGFRWADGAALYTSFNTILPPNSELCVAGGDAGIGPLSSSSRHVGGVHVVLSDGAVKFITDSIDAGDPSTGTVIRGGAGPRRPGSQSPYGLWGALGTRNAGESTDEWESSY